MGKKQVELCDPAAPLLGLCSSETKTDVQRNICLQHPQHQYSHSPKAETAQFSSTEESIEERGYVHTVSTYVAIERNMIPVPALIWINLKQMALNERRQS